MHSIRAYLQLVRFPAVFTAMADIFLGFLLVDPRTELEQNYFPIALLLVASCCLYMAGMVFNDVFDRKIDAEERPDRPIPSGRISVMSAVCLGILLFACGLGAANVRGVPSLLVALMIVVGILGYDGFLKKTVAGPLVMGCCRFLNVLLGASAVGSFSEVWAAPQICVAGGLGIYITGVTWFGRTEARQSNRYQLAGAMTVINLGLAAIVLFVTFWGNEPSSLKALLILAVIVLTINRRLTKALRNPQSRPVQDAIKMMLYSLVMLDATLVLFSTGNIAYAAFTAGLVIPAMILGRWIFVT